jgi:hypothetical protein
MQAVSPLAMIKPPIPRSPTSACCCASRTSEAGGRAAASRRPLERARNGEGVSRRRRFAVVRGRRLPRFLPLRFRLAACVLRQIAARKTQGTTRPSPRCTRIGSGWPMPTRLFARRPAGLQWPWDTSGSAAVCCARVGSAPSRFGAGDLRGFPEDGSTPGVRPGRGIRRGGVPSYPSRYCAVRGLPAAFRRLLSSAKCHKLLDRSVAVLRLPSRVRPLGRAPLRGTHRRGRSPTVALGRSPYKSGRYFQVPARRKRTIQGVREPLVARDPYSAEGGVTCTPCCPGRSG